MNFDRRNLLSGLCITGAALSVAACSPSIDPKDVGVVENLMREHGVLRRVVLVFRSCAGRLRIGQTFDTGALADAATLFQKFGEDYHEKKLEEAHIFPAVVDAGGDAATYIDTLKAQHIRGREITAYIVSAARKGAGESSALAAALDSFELMYENHAAREDTIIFPAWKNALSSSDIQDLSDTFADIERQEFGQDGFADAVRQIGEIEDQLNLSSISQFTAPSPGD